MLVTNLPLTSNTQSRVPLGAFFRESMLLGGMCTCIEARAHLELSGGLTGICTAFAELQRGPKLMLPAAVNVTLLVGEGGGTGTGGDA